MIARRCLLLALAFGVVATGAMAQNLPRAFERLDRDGDGRVALADVPERFRARVARLDTNGDGYLSKQEVLAQRGSARSVGGPPPSFADLRYSDAFERSLLDIWVPEGARDVPVVIFFHGGGFKGGDKSRVKLPAFFDLPNRGIAVASVGYPLKADIAHTGEWGHLPTIFEEVAKSLDYLRREAARLGIDADQMVLAGSSAGAVIAEHLAYTQDAEVMGVIAIQQPNTLALVSDGLRRGQPDLFLYTSSGPSDRTHHPDYAEEIHAACEDAGMTCALHGSGKSGLPALPAEVSIVDLAVNALGL